MKKLILPILLSLTTLLPAASVPKSRATVAEIPGLPRVLIIGDEIATGYIPEVRKLLEGKVNVQRPVDTVGSSSGSISKLDDWLKTGGSSKWDLIYFNFGNQDLRYIKSGTSTRQNVSPESYEKHLGNIVKKLKSASRVVIFATTTPIPVDSAGDPRKPEDVAIYNAAALRVMKANKIPVDDLNALITPKILFQQKPNDYRFTADGYKTLARQVASTIENALQGKSPAGTSTSAAAPATAAAGDSAETSDPDIAAPKKSSPSLAQITDNPKLPRVLLIGDSISIGYTLRVRAALEGTANVHRPPTNCGSTSSGLDNIDKWLNAGGSSKWDIIHFNWGLHDLKFLKPGNKSQNVPPSAYEKNLSTLVKKMKATGATLIFATTTPVADTQAGIYPRNAADVAVYNQIAIRVMKANGVTLVDDLNSVITPKRADYQSTDGVHFNTPGCDALGKAVSDSITYALELRKK